MPNGKTNRAFLKQLHHHKVGITSTCVNQPEFSGNFTVDANYKLFQKKQKMNFYYKLRWITFTTIYYYKLSEDRLLLKKDYYYKSV